MTPNRRAPGMICFRISSFFASSSVARILTPVVLPPGLARLEISPEATRSSAIATIGIAWVACWAARIAGSPRATMTLALSATSARASSGKPFDMALRESIFEANGAAVDLPACGQVGSKLCRHWLDGVRRVDA